MVLTDAWVSVDYSIISESSTFSLGCDDDFRARFQFLPVLGELAPLKCSVLLRTLCALQPAGRSHGTVEQANASPASVPVCHTALHFLEA